MITQKCDTFVEYQVELAEESPIDKDMFENNFHGQ